MSHDTATDSEIPAREEELPSAIDRDAERPSAPRYGAALSVLWWHVEEERSVTE